MISRPELNVLDSVLVSKNCFDSSMIGRYTTFTAVVLTANGRSSDAVPYCKHLNFVEVARGRPFHSTVAISWTSGYLLTSE